jgi:Arc/MetJ-type ribon-helix-helix transcriptional regulator
MKLTGTVSDDLALWVKERIESGEFYNTSHVLQKALLQFREVSEGKASGAHGTPPSNGNGKKGKAT